MDRGLCADFCYKRSPFSGKAWFEFASEFIKATGGAVALVFELILVALLALGWFAPRAGDRWLKPIEETLARFSRRKALTVVSLGIAAILIRLALLPVLPVPVPAVHDEFSYLLAADTFADGRLTNPPHPMWTYFDTFHVLQHPTYASKYPPANGAMMALGQLLGHPWIGVLLSMAAMVMAFTWMLQGWFPPPWALLGGVIVIARLGSFTYWVDSYYNGAVAAVGAALVLGAYPRIIHSARARDALLMSTGAMILACSRPVEGLIFCIPIAIALLLAGLNQRRPFDLFLRRVVLPMAPLLLGGLIFLAYYNARVTGSPTLFPYVAYHRQYFNYPVFAWGRVPLPLHYSNPQFEFFFNTWQRAHYPLTLSGWMERTYQTAWIWWLVFLGPILTVPFVMLLRVVSDKRMRLPLCQFFLSAAGLLSIVWFQPHYAAPMAATLFVLLIHALRHLRHAEIKGKPVGIFLTRLVVLLAIDWIIIQAGQAARHPVAGWANGRAVLVNKLSSLPGKHLVIVRYGSSHNVHHEWVYNAADIDHSKIVWARDIPGRDLQPLIHYFKDRDVWVLEADNSPPELRPFEAY
jgi:hypothetical protein